ncbi:MAG: nucleotidyl transferase AbiEii/AbiGii toxin family protein [Pseudomonadota bacterium]
MILKEEIQQIAAAKKLGMDIVEKDYILGWVLAGIHNHSATKNSWIFKGGTCLKKCYFETYRFSEDLDFTYQGETRELSEKFYKNIFIEIGQWIYNNSGNELPLQGIEFEAFTNKRNSTSIQGKLTYRGPIYRNLSITRLPRLKIDLTLDEPLVLEPQIKKVDHSYSDMLEEGKKILAYSYEELFAEKLRALVQRLRPRDLYDVVHLFQQKDLTTNVHLINQTLQKKCELRSVPFPKKELIENHDNRRLLESEWATQLRHQMPYLPPFELFLDELGKVLDWVSTKKTTYKE